MNSTTITRTPAARNRHALYPGWRAAIVAFGCGLPLDSAPAEVAAALAVVCIVMLTLGGGGLARESRNFLDISFAHGDGGDEAERRRLAAQDL